MTTKRIPNLEPKRINIDFPTWMVKKLDEEAQHIGVSRQAIIKTWLDENGFKVFFYTNAYKPKHHRSITKIFYSII